MVARARRTLADSTYAGIRRHKPDYWLLIFSALLLTIGLVVVYSISPGLAASQKISQNYFVTKQLIAVLLGIIGFAIAATGIFPFKDYLLQEGWQNALAWGTLIFFIYVPVIGIITWIIRRIAKIKSNSRRLRQHS